MDNQSQTDIEHGEGAFFSREAVSSMPWMIAGKLVLFFVYFGVSMLLVNGLGKEKFGVYSLMTNISSYMLVVCGLGLGTALMRYVPELATRKNRRGLLHLLWKSAILQFVAVIGMSIVLLSFSEPLQRLFKAEHVEHFEFYLKLACGLTGLLLLKDFVGTVFTSIFKTRIMAVLSVSHGLAWLALLWVWLTYRPAVGTVFFVQMLSLSLFYTFGAMVLFRYFHGLPWSTDEYGIGKRRTLSFSGTVMIGSVLRLVMFKYSEVFFLAAVGGTTLAGIYDLGFTLPYTAITFIPLALLPIFTAAFAEAYVKDNSCLERLISSYYKVLMVVALPVGILGAFFAPEAYNILFKGEMNAAGGIASAFCIVLMFPLVSMPLSAAIKAREKVLNMMPTLLLQIVVNLFLDWLLIVHFGMGLWGGIWAVAGTFVLTIPIRLWVVRGIVGGIHFPTGFFVRMVLVLVLLAGLASAISEKIGLFGLTENRAFNMGMLFVVAAVYLAAFILAIRYLHLLRNEDVKDFQALQIEKLNWILHILVR